MRATVYTVLGLLLFGGLLFVPAGTFDYWQGWAFIVVFVALTVPYTVYLAVKSPATLERRTHAGPVAETRVTQKVAVFGLQLSILGMIVVSAFDHRFGWSQVPTWLCVVGIVLVAVGLGIGVLVVIQNTWAAATIATADDQGVVSTGLYGLVRHPMYTGALLMGVGIPLGLGSYWALALFAVVSAALIVRIVDEEKMLQHELDGYPEYTEHVRYRLMPGVW